MFDKVTVTYVERTMLMHSVSESEVEMLSMLNDLQVGFASFGTLFLGIAIPDAYAWTFDKAGVVDGRKPLFFFAVAMACYLVMVWPRRRSNRVWQRIASQSTQKEPTSPPGSTFEIK